MVDGWVCWLMCVAEVERLEDAQGTFALGDKGSAGTRTLGKSKVRDGCEEELMKKLEANVEKE